MRSRMQCYLAVLVVLFVPLAYGDDTNDSYPTFPKCNPGIINTIKLFKLISGKQTDVLQKLVGKTFTILHTSYDHNNDDTKCIFMNTTNTNMDFTFIYKTESTPSTLYWKVYEDDDGVIHGQLAENEDSEHTWKWHTIFNDGKLVVCYICSDLEGSNKPPMLDIMLAKDQINPSTKAAVKNMYNVIKGWGLKLKYNYEPECM